MANSTENTLQALASLLASKMPEKVEVTSPTAATMAAAAEMQNRELEAKLEALKTEVMAMFSQYTPAPKEIVVKTINGDIKVNGLTHECFEAVINLVNNEIPVYMAGPAGTGKSHIARQVAEALKLDFWFSNCITQEYQVTGFIDANGRYHETAFYNAFTKGGLFFLDELDGSVPEALIHLNTALANGYFDFPTGRVEAHKDFRVIAAGNTLGTGADSQYTGRYQLDASTLDRFFVLKVDYSEALEMALSGNNAELVSFIHGFRKACDSAGISCIASYRSIQRIATLEKLLSLDEVLLGSLTKGLPKDDLRTIIANIPDMDDNKYFKALKKVQRNAA